jgi:hypothetical protein
MANERETALRGRAKTNDDHTVDATMHEPSRASKGHHDRAAEAAVSNDNYASARRDFEDKFGPMMAEMPFLTGDYFQLRHQHPGATEDALTKMVDEVEGVPANSALAEFINMLNGMRAAWSQKEDIDKRALGQLHDDYAAPHPQLGELQDQIEACLQRAIELRREAEKEYRQLHSVNDNIRKAERFLTNPTLLLDMHRCVRTLTHPAF